LFALLDATPNKKLLPTLIVLDDNLPHLDGEKTLILLKRDPHYKHIPVVMYATSMNIQKELRLLLLGACFAVENPLLLRVCTHYL